MHRVRLMGELERLLLDTIKAIAATIDARDGYTHRHSERVAALTTRLAIEMGLSDADRQTAELSALLHDVGKIAVPDSILNKPDRLTPEEFAEMQKHPAHGARILGNIQSATVKAVLPGVKYHHEKWDGTGYPEGLKGDGIPFLGRLLGVADFYDALTSARALPRAPMSLDEVVRLVAEGVSGIHFDPQIADAVVRLHGRGALNPELARRALRHQALMPAMRALLAIAAVAWLAGQAAPPPAPVALRFHHLHYAVEDPGAALGEAVERLGGARTIVQGLGVGVQVGKEYVLFERAGPATAGAMTTDVAAVYADAVDWLRQRGLAVAPATFAGTGMRGGMPSARLVHVAFAADNLAAAVGRVGITAANVTGDAARFVAPSGLAVEIVRDTDRPDTHWCPMHLDVRAPSPASCPICGMPLVPIPPPRIGEDRLDVDVRPRAGGGASGLRLTVRDPESGEPVTSFIDVHERPFHLFILGRDLRVLRAPAPRTTGRRQLFPDALAAAWRVHARCRFPAGRRHPAARAARDRHARL